MIYNSNTQAFPMRTTNLNRKFLEKFLKYIKAKLELTYANFYSTQIDEVGMYNLLSWNTMAETCKANVSDKVMHE